MKTSVRLILFALGLILISLVRASAQSSSGDSRANHLLNSGNRATYELRGGIITMYPRDRLASNLCFLDGTDGLVIEQGEVRNRCSHLRIENRRLELLGGEEVFAIGVQGGQYGVLVDIGEESQLTKRYGYLTWPGAAFTSIHLTGAKLFVLKDPTRNEFDELKEAAPLAEETSDRARLISSRAIVAGHIYIGRIRDRNDESFDMWVKILVLAHTPGQAVTMRWERL